MAQPERILFASIEIRRMGDVGGGSTEAGNVLAEVIEDRTTTIGNLARILRDRLNMDGASLESDPVLYCTMDGMESKPRLELKVSSISHRDKDYPDARDIATLIAYVQDLRGCSSISQSGPATAGVGAGSVLPSACQGEAAESQHKTPVPKTQPLENLLVDTSDESTVEVVAVKSGVKRTREGDAVGPQVKLGSPAGDGSAASPSPFQRQMSQENAAGKLLLCMLELFPSGREQKVFFTRLAEQTKENPLELMNAIRGAVQLENDEDPKRVTHTAFIDLLMSKENVNGFECLTRYLIGDKCLTTPAKIIRKDRLTAPLNAIMRQLHPSKNCAKFKRLGIRHRNWPHRFFFLRDEDATSG